MISVFRRILVCYFVFSAFSSSLFGQEFDSLTVKKTIRGFQCEGEEYSLTLWAGIEVSSDWYLSDCLLPFHAARHKDTIYTHDKHDSNDFDQVVTILRVALRARDEKLKDLLSSNIECLISTNLLDRSLSIPDPYRDREIVFRMELEDSSSNDFDFSEKVDATTDTLYLIFELRGKRLQIIASDYSGMSRSNVLWRLKDQIVQFDREH